jgi:catechol 2,3-dioxygenase-like lactoylglutathione lyase family enzyme
MQDSGTEAPFALERIEHVLLLVNGMDAALAFYERGLGATVESRLPRYGMTELRAGSSHLDLVDVSVPQGAWARPPIAGGRNVDHVAIRIDAADEAALRRHLAAHDVDIVEERIEESADGKSLSLYVRDPSGNTIELMTGLVRRAL